MFFLLLLLWILLNGRITWEIFWTGMVISALIYGFSCRFLGYSMYKDAAFFRRLPFLLPYFVVLVCEIIKANIQTMQMVLSSKNEIEPVIVTFHTKLKTSFARAVLANSITLTPGTITVGVKDDEFTVHALDKELAVGLDKSIFVYLLTKMENIGKEGMESNE